MRYRAIRRAERYLGLAVLAGMSSAAGAQGTQASVSVSTGASVETNPYNTPGVDNASIAATADVRPSLQWSDERSTASLNASAQFRQFVERYGLEDNYGLSGNVSTRVSERITVFSNAGFSSSQGGFGNFPQSALSPTNPTTPDVGPVIPDPSIIDVSLLGRRVRSTSFDFSAGGNAQVTEYSTLSLSVSGRGNRFRQAGFGDFNSVSGQSSYSHQISESTSVGVSGTLTRTDYLGTPVGDARTTSLSGTFNRKLGETWTLFLSAGLSRTRIDQLPGTPDSKFDSFTTQINFCNQGERGRLCISGSRSPEPSANGNVRVNTSFNADYSLRVSERETVTLSGSYARTGRGQGIAAVLPGVDFASANLRYENRLRDNLSFYAGTNTSKIFQSTGSNGTNFGVNVGLQYSFGVLR